MAAGAMLSACIWVNAWLMGLAMCLRVCVLRAVPKEVADVIMNGEGVADGLGELIIKPCLNRW